MLCVQKEHAEKKEKIQSPDLIPIEMLCQDLKRAVHKQMPTNLQERKQLSGDLKLKAQRPGASYSHYVKTVS